MDKITHIGLDVHKETITGATRHPGAPLYEERVIANTLNRPGFSGDSVV